MGTAVAGLLRPTADRVAGHAHSQSHDTGSESSCVETEGQTKNCLKMSTLLARIMWFHSVSVAALLAVRLILGLSNGVELNFICRTLSHSDNRHYKATCRHNALIEHLLK
jgi:hypothetical protein